MTSKDRHEARYQRRKAKRKARKQSLLSSLPSLEEACTFKKMYKYGLDCCKEVRWKQSTQNFETELVVRTAINRARILDGSYVPNKLKNFTISERGKIRTIDAPKIDDRQIQKTLCKEILQPFYQNSMIYDNGASLPGKGLHFSQKQLDKALRKHMRKYGMNGWIILADFKGFFPNADRSVVKSRHDALIDVRTQIILDRIIDSCPGYKGLPLGVEPSQLEMLMLPTALDNFMCCQVHLKGFGHYMDDYHILVPPDRNPEEIVKIFVKKAAEYGISVSNHKTKIVPIGKPFKFCKMKRTFTKSGKIIKVGCRDSYKRARRKIKKFAEVAGLIMTFEDVRNSMNSILSYYAHTDDHTKVLSLRRLFYREFGFSCENLKEFRRRDANAVCMSPAL